MFDLEVIFNRFEAALWLLIAAIIAGFALRRRWRGRVVARYHAVAVGAFAVFGVSDIIESFTGAWWRPWWLFVIKVACVGAFLYCLRAHRKATPPPAASGKSDPPGRAPD